MLIQAIERDTWNQIRQHTKPNVAKITTKPKPTTGTRRAKHGPCVFGHPTTAAIDNRGYPRWNAMPTCSAATCKLTASTPWAEVQPGAPLCGMCYQMITTAIRTKRIPRTPVTHRSNHDTAALPKTGEQPDTLASAHVSVPLQTSSLLHSEGSTSSTSHDHNNQSVRQQQKQDILHTDPTLTDDQDDTSTWTLLTTQARTLGVLPPASIATQRRLDKQQPLYDQGHHTSPSHHNAQTPCWSHARPPGPANRPAN